MTRLMEYVDKPTKVAGASAPTAETGDKSRKDHGKLQWHLVPWDAMKELVKVYMIGAEKYRPRGWESGMEYSRMYSAMVRHLNAWFQDGETHDPVDGQHHLASVAWGALGLIAYELRGIGNDDRPSVTRSG